MINGMSHKSEIDVIARYQLKNQIGVNDGISSLRGTKQSILVIGSKTRNNPLNTNVMDCFTAFAMTAKQTYETVS